MWRTRQVSNAQSARAYTSHKSGTLVIPITNATHVILFSTKVRRAYEK